MNGPNGDRSPRLTSQGLTNILWGYATLRYYPHKVLQAVTQELHRRMATLGQQARPPPLPAPAPEATPLQQPPQSGFGNQRGWLPARRQRPRCHSRLRAAMPDGSQDRAGPLERCVQGLRRLLLAVWYIITFHSTWCPGCHRVPCSQHEAR